MLGLCGGYQMLGRAVHDPLGVESEGGSAEGLGLLPVETELTAEKTTHLVSGEAAAPRGLLEGDEPVPLTGYEIHMGRSAAPTPAPVLLQSRSGATCDERDGAISEDGWILGTYVHGFLESDALRRRLLANLARRRGLTFTATPALSRDAAYDRLAAELRAALDVAAIRRSAGL